MVWVCIFLILISLTEPVPSSPLDAEFDTELAGSITGRVEDISCKEGKMTLTLSGAAFQKEGGSKPYILKKILVYTEEQGVYLGNLILAKGTLTKFRTPTNPGEFNSYYYYHSIGISYRMAEAKVMILDGKKDWLKTVLRAGRTSIDRVYQTWLPKEHAATLTAMFLGDKTELLADTTREYQKSGIGHLLAISGLHISMIGMGIYRLLLKLFKHRNLAVFAAMSCTVLYGIMTGFGISTKRAVLMMLISFAGLLLGRTYDMLSAMALSASFILAFHPLEIRNCGFLLSYGSILGIAVVYPMLRESLAQICEQRRERQKKRRRVQREKIQEKQQPWQVLKNRKKYGKGSPLGSFLTKLWKKEVFTPFLMSVSIQLVTTPILFACFYEYPLYSVLVNLLVLPLMSLLAVLSVAAGLLGLFWQGFAAVFAGGIYLLLEVSEAIAVFSLKLPHANIITGKPQASFYFCYYLILAGVLILWRVTRKGKVWLLLLLLLFLPLLPDNPGMQVTFLDVGQGDGIYIETKENLHILVDGGSTSKSKPGQYLLEPFLKSQGCKQLDYVFLTHLDEDHINGVEELIEFSDFGGVPIHTLVLGKGIEEDEGYDKLVELVQRHGIALQYIERGQEFKRGSFSLRCLNPDGRGAENDKNEASIVMEVSYGSFNLLLTGDMGEAEANVMQYLTKKHYQVLKVGHHGSKNSSSLPFLERVRPSYAVISCAKKNRYGHPNKDTLERLTAVKAKIIYTMEGGAICVKTDGQKFVLEEMLSIS